MQNVNRDRNQSCSKQNSYLNNYYINEKLRVDIANRNYRFTSSNNNDINIQGLSDNKYDFSNEHIEIK